MFESFFCRRRLVHVFNIFQRISHRYIGPICLEELAVLSVNVAHESYVYILILTLAVSQQLEE